MLQRLANLTQDRHYGWVIFALTGANLTVEGGMRNSVPVVFVALRNSFGQSAAATAAIFSAAGIAGGLAAPLVGWLLDRVGPRRLFPLAGVLILLGYWSSSFVSGFWQLFIFYSLIAALGETTISSFTATATLAPWFPKNRGRVLGLVDAGNPLGQGIFAPLAHVLISSLGWRPTFRIFGALFFLMVAPANFLMQRRPPPPETLEPTRYADAAADTSTMANILGRPTVWLLVLTRMFATFGIHMTNVHIVAFFIAAGYSGLQAASTIGAVGLVSLVGRPLSGALSDYLGRELVYTLGLGMQMGAIVLVLLLGDGRSLWPIVIFVALSGLSEGIAGLVVGAKAADIFPSSALGRVMGFIQMGRGVGILAGPILGGLLFDFQGDYRDAFTLAVSVIAVAVVIMWLSRFSTGKSQVPVS
ncbi:MAG: hypothetical protein BZY88_01590 [SAR202 cluster bacterium Io17-Chloro-G9]|nr:MAG: hypothetical protein BZY88_01590 [SAR202 cluster bacterium Io17-Chloro-G9]